MQINMETDAGVNLIRSFDAGRIAVNEEYFEHNIIVASDVLVRDWKITTPEALGLDDFRKMAALEPSIVLLGTGEQQVFPAPELLAPLMQHRIGLEAMTTRNACHTYNVLVHEGRRVVAALFV